MRLERSLSLRAKFWSTEGCNLLSGGMLLLFFSLSSVRFRRLWDVYPGFNDVLGPLLVFSKGLRYLRGTLRFEVTGSFGVSCSGHVSDIFS